MIGLMKMLELRVRYVFEESNSLRSGDQNNVSDCKMQNECDVMDSSHINV